MLERIRIWWNKPITPKSQFKQTMLAYIITFIVWIACMFKCGIWSIDWNWFPRQAKKLTGIFKKKKVD